MKICLIAAVGQNFAIGHNGKVPWHLPKDFAWFKAQTIGKCVIMGRKTFDALYEPYKPLPKRLNIVISRGPQQFFAPNVAWVHTLEDALTIAKINEEYKSDEIMIIGGGEIYSQALKIADRLYLTEIMASPEADAFFPAFDKSKWVKKTLQEVPAEEGRPAFSITQYDRL